MKGWAGRRRMSPQPPCLFLGPAHSRFFKGQLLFLQLFGQYLHLSKGKLQLLLFLGQEGLGFGMSSFFFLQGRWLHFIPRHLGSHRVP